MVNNTEHLNQLQRITAIGGGHGLGRLMDSLSFLQKRLVGVVATTDNGGSSGLLRKHHHCIAWGDIRNCLSQLAGQDLARQVLNYRFDDQSNLHGHSFGNLLLYTLDRISARPLDGIELLSRLLEVKSRVLPMSESPVDLIAETTESLACFGEVHIDALAHVPRKIALSENVPATPEVLDHVHQSDLIILGPGSFFTSVLPPLLVSDIAAAIRMRNPKCIYIDNLLPEQSPAAALSLQQRVDWIESIIGAPLLDLVISHQPHTQLSVPVLVDSASEPDKPHRHEKYKLRSALNQATAQLFDQNRKHPEIGQDI